jgi:hypothetical protein
MAKCNIVNVNSIYHSLTDLTNQKEKKKGLHNLEMMMEEEIFLDNK